MYKSISDVLFYNEILGRGVDVDGVRRPFNYKEFFEISDEIGANQRNPEYRVLFENLAKWSLDVLKFKSSLEIGCGPGYLLNCLNVAGVDAVGLDGNIYSKKYFDFLHSQYSSKYFIDPFFNGAYGHRDVVFSIECFEHIDDQSLHSLMMKITEQVSPEYIVFSSTPNFDPNPGFDFQWGHINVKSKSEWDYFFKQFGFINLGLRPPVTEWGSLYFRN